MPQPIFLPGLRLILFELQGSLSYSQTRNGIKSETHRIRDTDIEDEANSDDDSTRVSTTTKPGIDVSAVGMQLRLTKNDSLFELAFEGRDGSCAKWVFDGLAICGCGRMVATAAVQTLPDPSKCSTCGDDKTAIVVGHDQETQTEPVTMQSASIQTEPGIAMTTTGVQTTPASQAPSHEQKSQATQTLEPVFDLETAAKITLYYKAPLELESKSPTSASTQTDPVDGTKSTDIHSLFDKSRNASAHLKRKASSPPPSLPPLHKNAKSKHDSVPWYGHLYMTCHRTIPLWKGDAGTLHIEVEKNTVWYEAWSGKPNARTFESKQVVLQHKETQVVYQPLDVDVLPGDATHELLVTHRNTHKGAKTESNTTFRACCAKPCWRIWGSDELQGTKIFLRDPSVIVDAIVRCADRTSGRRAVHDPYADPKPRQSTEAHEITTNKPFCGLGETAEGEIEDDDEDFKVKLQEEIEVERGETVPITEPWVCPFGELGSQ